MMLHSSSLLRTSVVYFTIITIVNSASQTADPDIKVACDDCADLLTNHCAGTYSECQDVCMVQKKDDKLITKCVPDSECNYYKLTDIVFHENTTCCKTNECFQQLIRMEINLQQSPHTVSPSPNQTTNIFHVTTLSTRHTKVLTTLPALGNTKTTQNSNKLLMTINTGTTNAKVENTTPLGYKKENGSNINTKPGHDVEKMTTTYRKTGSTRPSNKTQQTTTSLPIGASTGVTTQSNFKANVSTTKGFSGNTYINTTRNHELYLTTTHTGSENTGITSYTNHQDGLSTVYVPSGNASVTPTQYNKQPETTIHLPNGNTGKTTPKILDGNNTNTIQGGNTGTCCGSHNAKMTDINIWAGKHFYGHFRFYIQNEEFDGWKCVVRFTSPVLQLSEWKGDIIEKSSDNTVYVIVNKPYDEALHVGDILDIEVQGMYSGDNMPSATAELVNLAQDGMKITDAPTTAGEKYNYNDVLMKSIIFFEAQRSGKLPVDNRLTWRGDSALDDHGHNGEDLTGGWYAGGGSVKFGFPMANAATMLTWGLLKYKDAYVQSGQLQKMYECIQWPLKWLLKCHTGPTELYVQVGDPVHEQTVWNRPENMTGQRPAYKVDKMHPGSDVAGEYAAAMAAGYLAFQNKDPTFAARLLRHAKEINNFAITYKGKYSDSIQSSASSYRSFAYQDELSWAGAWLFMATHEKKYLDQAEKYYQGGVAYEQSWDDKLLGSQILLYEITGKDVYRHDIEESFRYWMPGGTIPYTPKGLAFRNKWGNMQYVSNMAFMALLASENGLHFNVYSQWAKGQIHYALGDSGRSFVCGFGVNPPTQPYHRGASCPMMPGPCGWADDARKAPNPHVLYGALVAGPNETDSYTDSRNNLFSNEIGCDFNSGFQSAVAGLKSLAMKGLL